MGNQDSWRSEDRVCIGTFGSKLFDVERRDVVPTHSACGTGTGADIFVYVRTLWYPVGIPLISESPRFLN